jgi:hypothetical protein
MNFDDPTVRRIAQLVLTLLMLGLLAAGATTTAVVLDFGVGGSRSETVLKVAEKLPAVTGEKVNDLRSTLAVVTGAIPLMLTAVCFRKQGDTRVLSRFGLAMTLVLLLALLSGASGFLFIDPQGWQDGHALGLSGLLNVQTWAKTVASASIFYLAALLGIKRVK